MKLKAWPNGLGYTYGAWDLSRDGSGLWHAVKRSGTVATMHGSGASWPAAIASAVKI